MIIIPSSLSHVVVKIEDLFAWETKETLPDHHYHQHSLSSLNLSISCKGLVWWSLSLDDGSSNTSFVGRFSFEFFLLSFLENLRGKQAGHDYKTEERKKMAWLKIDENIVCMHQSLRTSSSPCSSHQTPSCDAWSSSTGNMSHPLLSLLSPLFSSSS